MTLVEVVGGLALLGTLLVAILMAKARYTRQAAVADRKLAAVAAADALLTEWHQQPSPLPRSGGGFVPGDGGFSWRTQIVPNGTVDDVGVQVVRLEVLDNRPASALGVLTSVEFLVNADPPGREGKPLLPTKANDPKKRGRPDAAASPKHEKSLHHP